MFKPAAVATLICLLAMPVPPLSAARAVNPTPPSGDALAVDLQPKTLKAWETYEARVDKRYEATSPDRKPFFALDAFGMKGWRAAAMKGDLAMFRIDRASPGESEIQVPDGRIHHWAGVIFVPGTSVTAVLHRLSELAGSESDHYEDVIASKLISKDGDRYRIFLKLKRSKFGVTATHNTEHAVAYRRLGGTRASARSVSTRIAELEHAGTPREHEKPIGSDSGYLWRLNAYWRYEATDGGVLIECESISLSREAPWGLRFLISGIVEGIAKESLERTLAGLRQFLVRST